MGRRWWSRVARERLLGSAPGSGGELLEVRENVTVLREGCGMLELMEKRGLDNSRYGWRGRGGGGGGVGVDVGMEGVDEPGEYPRGLRSLNPRCRRVGGAGGGGGEDW